MMRFTSCFMPPGGAADIVDDGGADLYRVLAQKMPAAMLRPTSALPLVNITAYKKADGTWGGSSSSEPRDAIVRTKSVYGNARQRYGVNRPRRTRRTSSKNQIISMY